VWTFIWYLCRHTAFLFLRIFTLQLTSAFYFHTFSYFTSNINLLHFDYGFISRFTVLYFNRYIHFHLIGWLLTLGRLQWSNPDEVAGIYIYIYHSHSGLTHRNMIEYMILSIFQCSSLEDAQCSENALEVKQWALILSLWWVYHWDMVASRSTFFLYHNSDMSKISSWNREWELSAE
jgi:hypothetical protein